MNPLNKWEQQSRQLLTEQHISHRGPGTILDDVNTLIQFIGVNGIATKSKQGNLPAAVLPELNARLSQPVELALDRPLLKDYPNIAGVYLLLRVMDLVRADAKRISVDEPNYAKWTSLNPTEKYFSLLEACLLNADGGVLGGETRTNVDGFAGTMHFLARHVTSRWKTFGEHCHTYAFLAGVSTWNTQLLVRFGLIEVRPRSAEGRNTWTRGWLMEKAKRTPWGTAIAWAIFEHLIATSEDESAVEYFEFQNLPGESDPGFFQPAFQPFFPEYQKVFSSAEPLPRPGVYIFKTALDPRCHGSTGVWRKLAVPGQVSLHALAASILAAFKFDDDDHLYEFRYKDQSGKLRVYNHPFTDEGPYSSETLVEEAGFLEKQIVRFRFDFGDDWRFQLRLERIDSPDETLDKIALIESAGEAPKQYPNWGD